MTNPQIQFTDVTLRDGLQMESQVIATSDKMSLFAKISSCNYSRIEITSFVSPKWIPQFSDADAFCQALFQSNLNSTAELMAFVPNVRGLERCLHYPIPWISAFVATSETFNQKNVNQSIDDTIASLKAVTERAHAENRKVRIYLSTVFGCPYEGKISSARVVAVIKKIVACQPDEISLGDTIGVATPGQVQELLPQLSALFPVERIALHFHNTYGLAMAAAEEGWRQGVRLFDGSTGGIGGCPYAKGATGNVPLEVLLYGFYRSGRLAAFPAREIISVCEYLDKILKLEVRSPIYDIKRRGGELHGT